MSRWQRFVHLFFLTLSFSSHALINIGYDPVLWDQCMQNLQNYCSNYNSPTFSCTSQNIPTFQTTHGFSSSLGPYTVSHETQLVRCNCSDSQGNQYPNYSRTFCGTKTIATYGDDRPSQLTTRSPQPICHKGSIIDVDNLALGENLSLTGTNGDDLTYFTNRVSGRAADYTIQIPVIVYPTQSSPDVNLRVKVAGRTFTQTYLASQISPGLKWEFIWDGKDASGNDILASATAEVEYLESSSATTPIVHMSYPLGGWKARNNGLGGWSFSSHHYYDSLKGWVYFGDGSIRAATPSPRLLDSSGKVSIYVAPEDFNVYLVPSGDGLEGYLFDRVSGRHLRTMSTRSGKTLKTFAYNTQGELTSVTDAFGNQTTITRPTGYVQIQAPHGQITTLELDSNGWAEKITTPGGKIYEVTYRNALGLIDTFKKPSGEISTFSYDTSGYVSRDESTSGAFWDLNYVIDLVNSKKSVQMTSAAGRLYSYEITNRDGTPDATIRTEISPGGATRKIQYNPTPGSQSKIEEASGLITLTTAGQDARFPGEYLYNNSTFINSGVNALSITETRANNFDYADMLKLNSEQITISEGLDSFFRSFDGSTLAYTNTSQEGRVLETKINQHDQVISIKEGNYLPMTLSYDILGRLDQITQGTRTTTTAYNTQGFPLSITNALNQTTSFEYSLDGEVTKQILPNGREVSYTYDANGNLASVTPPSRPSHNFLYNLFNLIVSYFAPMSTTTSYEYNLDKQVTKIIRPDTSQILFSYKPVSGLLDQITTPQGNYVRNYNSANQITSLNAPGGFNMVWGYDYNLMRNQMLTTPDFTAKVEYTFNKFLPVTQTVTAMDGSSHQISITYDRDRLPTTVGAMSLVRDTLTGKVTSTTVGNVTEAYTYDSSYGEVASYTAQYNGSDIFKEVYTRDALGRISTKVVTIQGVTKTYDYIYDLAGRLVETKANGVTARQYTYDANSNRTQFQEGSTTINATYDNQDRMLTYGTKSFTYTPNGDRLTSYVDANNHVSYSYNALGALSQTVRTVASVADTFDYSNSGLGHKIERIKNGIIQKRYVYDDLGRLIAELNLANNKLLIRYVYATKSHVPDYMVKQGVKYKLIHDQVGSIRMVVDVDTGSVVSRIDYDEFGRITSSVAQTYQPLSFAGGVRDEATGLLRFGARDYDPEVGRWVSKDPILFNGGDSNLYEYVLADPVNLIDPSGLIFETWIGENYSPNRQLIIGGVLAGIGTGLLHTGYRIFPIAPSFGLGLAGAGLVLGYEGSKNIEHARTRGAPEWSPLDPLASNPSKTPICAGR